MRTKTNIARFNQAYSYAAAAVTSIIASPAFADLSSPFDKATSAANSVATSLTTFALAVGLIGTAICLMLGFFGRLNWKWIATSIGVSFALAIVKITVNGLFSLGA